MVTWLSLTPGARVARSERVIRWSAVAMAISVCFLLAMFF